MCVLCHICVVCVGMSHVFVMRRASLSLIPSVPVDLAVKCARARTHTHIYTYTHTNRRSRTRTQTHTHAHTHTHTHTSIHTHVMRISCSHKCRALSSLLSLLCVSRVCRSTSGGGRRSSKVSLRPQASTCLVGTPYVPAVLPSSGTTEHRCTARR